MLKRGFYIMTGAATVQWRLNRKIFIWLGLFVVIGVVVGLITVFNARLNIRHISENMLDRNLLRVIRPTAGFGGIIMGRLLAFLMMFTLAFVLCLNRWSVFLIFPVTVYLGFSFVINMYWIFARFGWAMAAPLFLVYFILLPIYLCLVLCAIVYSLRVCAPIRSSGFRGAICWNKLGHGGFTFLVAIFTFALLEFFFFWLVLSRIVFVI